MTHERRETMLSRTPAAWVVLLNGEREGDVHPVPLNAPTGPTTAPGCSIGAAVEDDLHLGGYAGVAPGHGRVAWRRTWFFVNGSSPDTRIDGEQVPPFVTRELSDGAVLELGAARLLLRAVVLELANGRQSW